MDENYLDNLLNEFSLDKEIDNKIEDELDSQMMEEKHKKQEENVMSDEDLFNLDLNLEADGVTVNDDLHFSEEQMDELDQLDDLADLDIGDLDFSDIDFEDLDITKLDGVQGDDFEALLKDFEGDLEIENLFDDKEAEEVSEISDEIEPIEENETQKEDTEDKIEDNAEPLSESDENDTEQGTDSIQAENLNEDAFDADSFLDTLLEESEEETEQPVLDLPEEEEDTPVALKEEETLSQEENNDLDALFSMLDMNEIEDLDGEGRTDSSDDEDSTAALLEGLDGMESSDGPVEQKASVTKESETAKKKHGFMEILFGEPDEEDILSEEEIAAIEAKKEAKKAKKKEAKEAKKAKNDALKEEKALKAGQKKKQDEEKKKVRAEKKAKQKAEALANAEPEKKLNKPMVIFIFSLFLGGTFLFYMAANDFNYKQAIEKASKYFANQKYRNAYDEIVGVEVKSEDEELKDRIYTVMYVERLYESYENNIVLGREEKALDALLRGVDKYFEHYEEAGELGITSDLDYSFSQIRDMLSEKYGISVDRAIEINALENYEYVKTINEYIGGE